MSNQSLSPETFYAAIAEVLQVANLSNMHSILSGFSKTRRTASRHCPAKGEYIDVAGFCKSASLDDIHNHGHVLTPGRYVGAAEQEDDGEPFTEKMQRLTAQWREQQEATRLDTAIEANL